MSLPVLVAGRCVHERVATAHCRACALACPRAAVAMTDEELRIDDAACDGCGLCVAVCPQEAIGMDRVPGAPGSPTIGEPCVDLICDRAPSPEGTATVPCLHAMGWQALVRLRGRGLRSFRTFRGDCSRCDRRPTGQGFDDALAHVNAMLEGRGLEPLGCCEGTAAGSNRGASVEQAMNGSRRKFLRRLIDAPPVRSSAVGPESPASLLPAHGREPIHPRVPVIDPERCRGCDACVRLCPTGAIALHADIGGASYLVRAARCTGCGVCTDVCEAGAITVSQWEPQRQDAVRLAAAGCPRCGVVHHAPVLDPGQLCPVCAAPRERARLFVVETAEAPHQSASAA